MTTTVTTEATLTDLVDQIRDEYPDTDTLSYDEVTTASMKLAGLILDHPDNLAMVAKLARPRFTGARRRETKRNEDAVAKDMRAEQDAKFDREEANKPHWTGNLKPPPKRPSGQRITSPPPPSIRPMPPVPPAPSGGSTSSTLGPGSQISVTTPGMPQDAAITSTEAVPVPAPTSDAGRWHPRPEGARDDAATYRLKAFLASPVGIPGAGGPFNEILWADATKPMLKKRSAWYLGRITNLRDSRDLIEKQIGIIEEADEDSETMTLREAYEHLGKL